MKHALRLCEGKKKKKTPLEEDYGKQRLSCRESSVGGEKKKRIGSLSAAYLALLGRRVVKWIMQHGQGALLCMEPSRMGCWRSRGDI